MITPDRARQMLLTAGADGFTAPEMLVTLELATQAPVMAEQIANMRYEYAVRAPSGEWVRETDEGELALTISHMRALRHYHPISIEQLCELASDQFNCECRVVRRLVTDWEVAE